MGSKSRVFSISAIKGDNILELLCTCLYRKEGGGEGLLLDPSVRNLGYDTPKYSSYISESTIALACQGL